MHRLLGLTQRLETTGPIQKTWEDLPFEFKVMVKDHLDVDSRTALRCCSKSDRDVVDSGSVALVRLEIRSELKQFLKHTQFECATTKKRETAARRYATSIA
ncbi:hypothetical protein GCK72_021879 [Caenorhabditis remanei]|uniref:F-box domain-containing protein n=1 Tax=Caenorhabditis remanei TaxID=31234 RepID=A0A6A5GJ90_CAERE|nr:hypothetical protein GCK72_021879 [Caenorhabditis remanei]KAF1755310.1 hypothetical protein GCK72_021879 [Caenorhabditis remanei]